MRADFQTFLINLDRSEDRLRTMRQRLERAGLPWQRVAAVDGKTLDLRNLREVDERGFRRRHGKRLNPAEVGCYLSHIKALKAFLDGPWTWALILEDDADFPDDFGTLIEQLLERSDQWDVLKLSSFHGGSPVPVAELPGSRRLAVPLARLMNANCILFNRHAARVLLKRLLPMTLPYDHALEQAFVFGLRLRTITPIPCPAETGLPSTIGDRAQLRPFKLRWYKRLPAMGFRMSMETRRVVFGLKQVLSAGKSARPD
ncbi:glycosyltransferase family 25 protein [Variovorax dokdonensis]|uniref:Glycosyltransferase family 25 protein n=1 Tax=Variovorax dokdonensis TaxID=344883 RepID=A0ABT7NC75_9BURK|nr:glycosyltransferase family 25 protein [Variovorax dokdonensis]MDM0045556.1 glycosyltransferase family 25 protein [Variovorax dokdonensis]